MVHTAITLSMDYSKIITVDPAVRSGKPSIRDTRMTVTDVLEYLAGGMSEDEILADFPYLTREDIRAVSKVARRLYDCCVDLGFTAADTVGNARETATWAKSMGYDSLIVVTADYHMPRAMLELWTPKP